MCEIQQKLKSVLIAQGASLVGFADLRPVWKGSLKTGVSVALPLPREVVRPLPNGPVPRYYDAYCRLNGRLDRIVTAGAEYLKAEGYHAFAQTAGAVNELEDYRTELPHKTVATRSGLGWIGKCALLVTPEYGSAVRLSSILTDAPVRCGVPIAQSRCGSCTACADVCPGKAVSGKVWSAGVDRNDFFNPYACRKAARALARERIQREITLCGRCIAACPYTKRYLAEK